MDIANPLKMLEAGASAAKTILTAETVLEKAELQLRMAEIMAGLASARLALVEAEEELRVAQKELQRLRQAKAYQQPLFAGRGGYHWQTNGEGKPIGFPCCPSCLEKEERQVKMVRDGSSMTARCPRCEAKFERVTYYNTPVDDAADEARAAEEIAQDEAVREQMRRLGETLA